MIDATGALLGLRFTADRRRSDRREAAAQARRRISGPDWARTSDPALIKRML